MFSIFQLFSLLNGSLILVQSHFLFNLKISLKIKNLQNIFQLTIQIFGGLLLFYIFCLVTLELFFVTMRLFLKLRILSLQVLIVFLGIMQFRNELINPLLNMNDFLKNIYIVLRVPLLLPTTISYSSSSILPLITVFKIVNYLQNRPLALASTKNYL